MVPVAASTTVPTQSEALSAHVTLVQNLPLMVSLAEVRLKFECIFVQVNVSQTACNIY